MAMISLAVSEFDRAAPNGTGKYKAGANYAGGLLATLNAQGIGANEALYLDSANNKFMTRLDQPILSFLPRMKNLLPHLPMLFCRVLRVALLWNWQK